MTLIHNRRELVEAARAKAAVLRAEAELLEQLAAYAELAPKRALGDPLAQAIGYDGVHPGIRKIV